MRQSLFATMLITFAAQAQAGYIAIGEVGDIIGTATNVDAHFDLTSDSDIFNSTTISHASITSALDTLTDVDWYSFTGTAGSTVDLDIDHGYFLGGSLVNTFLALFDSQGTLIGYNDDSSPTDTGSFGQFDSFLGTYTLGSSGTFFAAVSPDQLWPTQVTNPDIFNAPLDRPDSLPDTMNGGVAVTLAVIGDSTYAGTALPNNTGNYTLHISTDAEAEVVSEPSSFALLGLGGLAMFGYGLRRRRKMELTA